MTEKVKTTAIVTVTLEVLPGDSWGETCELAQVFKQAKESAENRLRNLFISERAWIKIKNMTVKAIMSSEES